MCKVSAITKLIKQQYSCHRMACTHTPPHTPTLSHIHVPYTCNNDCMPFIYTCNADQNSINTCTSRNQDSSMSI